VLRELAMGIMKTLSAAMLVAFLAIAPPSQATGTPEYLGEYCWATDATSQGDFLYLRLGILAFGDDHFPVFGTARTQRGTWVLHGNAELTSSGLQATLNGSTTDPYFIATIRIHVDVDRGYFYALGFESPYGTDPLPISDEGLIDSSSCPD
jgi:hypothetical protein